MGAAVRTKLNAGKVRAIRRDFEDLLKKTGSKYGLHVKLAKKHKTTTSTIERVVNRKIWKWVPDDDSVVPDTAVSRLNPEDKMCLGREREIKRKAWVRARAIEKEDPPAKVQESLKQVTKTRTPAAIVVYIREMYDKGHVISCIANQLGLNYWRVHSIAIRKSYPPPKPVRRYRFLTYKPEGQIKPRKTTAGMVKEIRRRIDAGEFQEDLVKEFNLASSNISNIATGKTFEWVTEDTPDGWITPTGPFPVKEMEAWRRKRRRDKVERMKRKLPVTARITREIKNNEISPELVRLVRRLRFKHDWRIREISDHFGIPYGRLHKIINCHTHKHVT